MYPLLAPFVRLFIMTVIAGAVVIDKCAVYQNTVINKTFRWPLWTSSIVIGSMAMLTHNTVVILAKNISRGAVAQAIFLGIISAFLAITILLALCGMAKRIELKLTSLSKKFGLST